MTDLCRKYRAALRSTRFADLAPMVGAGVGWRAITCVVPAFATIRVTGGIFEFDESGGDAFVVPVRIENPITPEAFDPATAVSNGAIVDLVAFHPLHPDRWVLRRDAAEWLGAVEPQHLDPEPVTIWRSPMSWLQAGCLGLVLLGDQNSRYGILSLLHSIIAEDGQHAAELRRELARPWPVPQVISPREARRAA